MTTEEAHLQNLLRRYENDEVEVFFRAVANVCAAFAGEETQWRIVRSKASSRLESDGLLIGFGGRLVLSERAVAVARTYIRWKAAGYEESDALWRRVGETLQHLRVVVEYEGARIETSARSFLRDNKRREIITTFDEALITGRAVSGGAGAGFIIEIA